MTAVTPDSAPYSYKAKLAHSTQVGVKQAADEFDPAQCEQAPETSDDRDLACWRQWALLNFGSVGEQKNALRERVGIIARFMSALPPTSGFFDGDELDARAVLLSIPDGSTMLTEALLGRAAILLSIIHGPSYVLPGPTAIGLFGSAAACYGVTDPTQNLIEESHRTLGIDGGLAGFDDDDCKRGGSADIGSDVAGRLVVKARHETDSVAGLNDSSVGAAGGGVMPLSA